MEDLKGTRYCWGKRKELQFLILIFSAKQFPVLHFLPPPSTFSVLLPDNCLIDCGGGSKGSLSRVVAESATVHGSLKHHMSQADTAVLRLALILTHECQKAV